MPDTQSYKKHHSYIQPTIKIYASFKELLEARSIYGDYYSSMEKKSPFENISRLKRAFIVAEPGYGKTRLLKEITISVKNEKKKGIYLDLKKIDTNIKSFISKNLFNADVIDELSSEEKLQMSAFIKTKGFSLKDSEGIVVCLDALDEIQQQDFSKVVDRIKGFLKQYKNTHLFISCRSHHLKKYQELFLNNNFSYVYIDRFSIYQAQEYLGLSGISFGNTEKIIDIFESKGRVNLVLIPRYLEMVIDIIKEKGVEHTGKLAKTEIFEHFIYKKLEIEEKKINNQKKEIIKRVLEKLALLMEIYQTSIITKEELMTFFDDVKSNLNISFLQQIPIEIFYDRSLLKVNIDTIEFENTEFQEYLAAKELLRLGRVEQVIFDVAVDHELREISPSWFNTLGFVIDLDISLLKPILFFGFFKDNIVQDEGYHDLLTGVDPNRLSIDDRKEIFEKVFIYYQSLLHGIGIDLAKKLSLFFDISQNYLLKESIDCAKKEGTGSFVREVNVACILEFLIANGTFEKAEREYWKNKLIVFAKDKSENSVLQGNALHALKEYKDITLIKQVSHLFNHNDESIVSQYLTACMDVNPNDPFSIQCLVNAIKRNNITAMYKLQKIKGKKAVNILLDYFLKDQDLLSQFIEDGKYYGNNQLVQNIRNVMDNEIQKKLENIIKTAFSIKHWYSADGLKFINGLALLLKERNKNYIFNLILMIKKSRNLTEELYRFVYIFAALLEKKQVSKFVKTLKGFKDGELYALQVLQLIKASKRKCAVEIYEEGRKYLKKEYIEAEKCQEKQSKKTSRDDDIYKKFKFKLGSKKGKYYLDV